MSDQNDHNSSENRGLLGRIHSWHRGRLGWSVEVALLIQSHRCHMHRRIMQVNDRLYNLYIFLEVFGSAHDVRDFANSHIYYQHLCGNKSISDDNFST